MLSGLRCTPFWVARDIVTEPGRRATDQGVIEYDMDALDELIVLVRQPIIGSGRTANGQAGCLRCSVIRVVAASLIVHSAELTRIQYLLNRNVFEEGGYRPAPVVLQGMRPSMDHAGRPEFDGLAGPIIADHLSPDVPSHRPFQAGDVSGQTSRGMMRASWNASIKSTMYPGDCKKSDSTDSCGSPIPPGLRRPKIGIAALENQPERRAAVRLFGLGQVLMPGQRTPEHSKALAL